MVAKVRRGELDVGEVQVRPPWVGIQSDGEGQAGGGDVDNADWGVKTGDEPEEGEDAEDGGVGVRVSDQCYVLCVCRGVSRWAFQMM